MEEPVPVPEQNAFRVQVSSFEGPLDLLLHLIRTHELDILDLPISFVTERYLEYLGMMRELDLDVASEYLLMAATLAHIKSKELLPQVPDEQQEVGEEVEVDPRTELIRRLLEYQKYKAVADELGARSLAGRDVFLRGAPPPEAEGPAPLAEVGLFHLLEAFERVLHRVKGRIALEVTADTISVQERMTQLVDMLRERRACAFEDLFAEDRTRSDVVVTFLALLEMTRLHMTRVFQTESWGPLHVHYALLDADAPTVPPGAGDEFEARPEAGPAELDADDEITTEEDAAPDGIRADAAESDESDVEDGEEDDDDDEEDEDDDDDDDDE